MPAPPNLKGSPSTKQILCLRPAAPDSALIAPSPARSWPLDCSWSQDLASTGYSARAAVRPAPRRSSWPTPRPPRKCRTSRPRPLPSNRSSLTKFLEPKPLPTSRSFRATRLIPRPSWRPIRRSPAPVFWLIPPARPSIPTRMDWSIARFAPSPSVPTAPS